MAKRKLKKFKGRENPVIAAAYPAWLLWTAGVSAFTVAFATTYKGKEALYNVTGIWWGPVIVSKDEVQRPFSPSTLAQTGRELHSLYVSGAHWTDIYGQGRAYPNSLWRSPPTEQIAYLQASIFMYMAALLTRLDKYAVQGADWLNKAGSASNSYQKGDPSLLSAPLKQAYVLVREEASGNEGMIRLLSWIYRLAQTSGVMFSQQEEAEFDRLEKEDEKLIECKKDLWKEALEGLLTNKKPICMNDKQWKNWKLIGYGGGSLIVLGLLAKPLMGIYYAKKLAAGE